MMPIGKLSSETLSLELSATVDSAEVLEEILQSLAAIPQTRRVIFAYISYDPSVRHHYIRITLTLSVAGYLNESNNGWDQQDLAKLALMTWSHEELIYLTYAPRERHRRCV
jgi:hypothetical protein